MTSHPLACGELSLLLVFLGVAGFVVSILALLAIGVKREFAGPVGLVAVVLGLSALSASSVASRQLQRAVAEVPSNPQTGVDDARERTALIEEARRSARECNRLGIQSGALPLTAGTIAVLAGWMRRRKASPGG